MLSCVSGDYNRDALVGGGDFLTWQNNFGSATSLPNDDGLPTPIGQAHYDLWQTNYGNLVGAGEFFCDDFENGNPLINDGVGGNWSDQSQGSSTLLSESGTEITVNSLSSTWDISKIRTTDGFAWGSKATFVLTDSRGADQGSGTFDPTLKGVDMFGWSQISIADSANTEPGFGGSNNDNLAGLTIDVGTGTSGGSPASAFRIYVPNTGNDTNVAIGNGVFDSVISPANPLVTTIETSPTGELSITFNKTYNGGLATPIVGNALGNLGGAVGGTFDVAIGAQGPQQNHAASDWDRVTVDTLPVIFSESLNQTIVNENDATYNVDTYTIVLDAQPTSDVTITATPSNSEVELNNGGAGTPLQLTFNANDWDTPQTVTVKAILDAAEKEGVHSSTIQHTSSSSDANFDDLELKDLSVTVVDAANAYYPAGFNVYGKTGSTDYSLEKVTHFATGSTVYQVDGTVAPALPGTDAFVDRVHRFGVKIFVNFTNDVGSGTPNISIFDQVTDNANGSRDSFVNNIHQHIIANDYDGAWFNIEWSSVVPPWVGHNLIMGELDTASGGAYEIISDVFINRGELDAVGLPHVDALTMMSYNDFSDALNFPSYWTGRGASTDQLTMGMATGWNPPYALDPADAYNRTQYALANGFTGVFLFGFDSEVHATSMLRGVRDALFDFQTDGGLLVDGSFEFAFTDPAILYAAGQKLGTNPPAAGAGGWQVVNTTSFVDILGSTHSSPQLPGSFNQAHIADGGGNTGMIRQEFATVIGETYEANAWAALNCCTFNGDWGINIHVGGVSTGEISVVSPRSGDWIDPSGLTHEVFSTAFVADDTTSYIEISNVLDLGVGFTNQNGAGMNIDNVSVTLISASAPNALLALGGLGGDFTIVESSRAAEADDAAGDRIDRPTAYFTITGGIAAGLNDDRQFREPISRRPSGPTASEVDAALAALWPRETLAEMKEAADFAELQRGTFTKQGFGHSTWNTAGQEIPQELGDKILGDAFLR
ncbi:hypothetical protein OAS39_06635 [Pirellulales bacterium]|nr:hypothetical protein [Pirellulales bacterium]